MGALWVTFPVPAELFAIWERRFSSWQSQQPHDGARRTAGPELPCRLEGSHPALLRLQRAAVC